MILLSLLLGCVPRKDFDALQAQLDAERSRAAGLVTAHAAEVKTLEEALAEARSEAGRLAARVQELQIESENRRRTIESLNAEKASLVKDRSQLRASVAEMEAALEALEERRAAAEARVAEYRELLAKFKKLIDAGKLRVKIVDGRMVVELATDVLFASGRADLSAEGKAAVGEVAAVLATLPDRSFQVEGHTDTVPIRTDRYPSNWELAAGRAITVVHELVAGGVAPGRVSAASFGEHRPVQDNATDAGKSANRRIEIVVVPDLSLLPGYDELQELAAP